MLDQVVEEELPPSKLGKKDYWDEVYEWVLLSNCRDIAEHFRRENRVFSVSSVTYSLFPFLHLLSPALPFGSVS